MKRLFRLSEFRPDPDRDIREEIDIHIDLETEALMSKGMSEERAREQAIRRFGNRRQIEREARGHATAQQWTERIEGWFSTPIQDLRFSLRTLRKRPLFTSIAVLTLGLGIGFTTAIFTLVNGVLLRQLPYEDPDALVNVWLTNPEWRDHEFLGSFWNSIPLSFEGYRVWRERNTLFQDMAIYGEEQATFTDTDTSERIHIGLASASLLPVLGAQPAIGRSFMQGEDGPTAERVAILGDQFWRDQFGADKTVLGRTISLDAELYTVIGVLPPGFHLRSLGLGEGADTGTRALWIPIGQPRTRLDRGNQSFEGIGRLKEGVSMGNVLGETEAILRGDSDRTQAGVRLVPRKEAEVGYLRPRFTLLFLGAGLLLVIACGNLATLLIGEATRRQRELVARSALGAGRARIVRLLLTESILLGLFGSVAGVALAYLVTSGLIALSPPIPRLGNVVVDGRVLLFGCTLGLTTSLLFGLVPALMCSRHSLRPGLAGRDRSGGSSGTVLRHGVLSLEVAMAGVLLVAAILLSRSLSTLLSVDPGFASQAVSTIRASLPEERYPTDEETSSFFRQVQEAIEAIPIVTAVGGVEEVPLAGSLRTHQFRIKGREVPPEEPLPSAQRAVVFPGYHETMRIPLVDGRTFSAADDLNGQRVLLVSESLARRHWPDESPIGSVVEYEGDRTIVGVVGDVNQGSLDSEVEPTLYLPHAQLPSREMNFVARSDADPRGLMALMRQAVKDADSGVPVTRSSTVVTFIKQATGDRRYQFLLMLAFAVCSAFLAAAGVFGVSARAAAQRSREMGIRRALGAREGHLVRMTVGQTMMSGVLGTGVGLLCALWVTRGMSGFLFGIETWDPRTYLIVLVLLLLVSVMGSYAPARRVAKMDPTEVLKAE